MNHLTLHKLYLRFNHNASQGGESQLERKEKDDFDVDIQACSIMDCTGLIPSLPQDEAEKEAYEDLYPYVTKAVSSDRE